MGRIKAMVFRGQMIRKLHGSMPVSDGKVDFMAHRTHGDYANWMGCFAPVCEEMRCEGLINVDYQAMLIKRKGLGYL